MLPANSTIVTSLMKFLRRILTSMRGTTLYGWLSMFCGSSQTFISNVETVREVFTLSSAYFDPKGRDSSAFGKPQLQSGHCQEAHWERCWPICWRRCMPLTFCWAISLSVTFVRMPSVISIITISFVLPHILIGCFEWLFYLHTLGQYPPPRCLQGRGWGAHRSLYWTWGWC